jgi:tetratricopeptide (TPR) repeat protein
MMIGKQQVYPGSWRLSLKSYVYGAVGILVAVCSTSLAEVPLEDLVAKGRFEEAQGELSKLDVGSLAYWEASLVIGDGYYGHGKYAEARTHYDAFLTAFPDGPPDVLSDFYMQSAYKYTQLLALAGDKRAALPVFRKLLKYTEETHIKRQLMGELCEALLFLAIETDDEARRERHLNELEGYCNKLLWMQDLWFGRGVVMLAHAKYLRGEPEEAVNMLTIFMSKLKELDGILRELPEGKANATNMRKLSPLPHARYLLGLVLYDQAMALLALSPADADARERLVGTRSLEGEQVDGAYQHFLNMAVRYGDTRWGKQSKEMATVVEQVLKDSFGITVKKSSDRP